MSIQKSSLLFAGGFLLGTLGLKVLKSQPARKLAVNVLAQGMKAKAGCESVFEEARAQFDDIVAEAGYLKDSEGSACTCASGTSPCATD